MELLVLFYKRFCPRMLLWFMVLLLYTMLLSKWWNGALKNIFILFAGEIWEQKTDTFFWA